MSLEKLGRYDLMRVLGRGAMGLVYEGRDPSLDRRVAIKTIRVENLSQQAAADYEARFRVEARSAARLQHPNIVSVYDAGRDDDIAFLVMEFIQGDDLKHHLDQGVRHSLAQTVAIMDDLLSALDYAHRQGIIHRDIKPANLLIEADGRVKLTDFGVARMQDSGDATRTQGTMVGTLKYMSPEQVQGRPVDARADLFAAGIVLYQLLTGKRPFDGDSDFAVIQQVVGQSPAVPSALNPDLPPAIDAVVATALAKSRDQRFASAQAFAVALRAASQDAVDPTIVPPASPPRKAAHSIGTTGIDANGEALVGLQSDVSLNLSALTQEVELVYWKDIKDSSDIKDIQGFLAKFPVGIYADLAMRRLRKLGVQSDQNCTDAFGATIATTTWATSEQATQADKTVYVARHDEFPPHAAAPAGPPANAQRFEETMALRPVPGLAATDHRAEAIYVASSLAVEAPALVGEGPSAGVVNASAPTAANSEGSDSSTGQISRTALIFRDRRRFRTLLGVAVLAAFGLGAKILWPVAEAPIPQAEALSDKEEILRATPSAPAPAAAPVIPAEPVAATRPGSAATPEPVSSASEKKPANEKKTLTKSASVLAAAGVEAVATAPVEPAVAARRLATDPRQSCEDRLLIAFQMCMTAQCSRPVFSSHPVCIERRVMDQGRREAEHLR
ncbi:MAG: serine/threonine-protein kinase [Burkholderiaceae bacterium]